MQPDDLEALAEDVADELEARAAARRRRFLAGVELVAWVFGLLFVLSSVVHVVMQPPRGNHAP